MKQILGIKHRGPPDVSSNLGCSANQYMTAIQPRRERVGLDQQTAAWPVKKGGMG